MTAFRRLLIAGLSTFVLMASGSAHAIFRAYLSISGNDANDCTLPTPCRLLPRALTVVDSGGEIWMLNSANYNTTTVSVTKSVTILAVPGELGSVLGNNGTAVAINGAGIEVTLQNLNIRSSNGDIGILIGNAASVSVINCNIFGFKGFNNDGLAIWSITGANATKVNVVGSVLRNNVHGLVVAGNGRATISKTHILNNSGVGVWSNSGTGISVVHVSDSVASGNGAGFVAAGSPNAAFNSYMYITRSVASENTTGFQTDGGGTAYMVVGDSMATNNGTGFNNVSGAPTLWSRGNNIVLGNTTLNTSGTITPYAGN